MICFCFPTAYISRPRLLHFLQSLKNASNASAQKWWNWRAWWEWYNLSFAFFQFLCWYYQQTEDLRAATDKIRCERTRNLQIYPSLISLHRLRIWSPQVIVCENVASGSLCAQFALMRFIRRVKNLFSFTTNLSIFTHHTSQTKHGEQLVIRISK